MLAPTQQRLVKTLKSPLHIGLWVLSLCSTAWSDAPVREDFNTLSEVQNNWAISTWGIETLQYSADNVQVDNGVLVLKLNASPQGTVPVGGEITYKPRKFLYGSYRASIKTTNVPGSVIGWFVYQHGEPGDGKLHEVDFEMLTNLPKRMYFTLHHDTYNVDHKTYDVSFNPWEAFHEYRFDWHKDSVVYYIDGQRITKLTKKVPDDSTVIMLNHWSKNIPGWGGPAPTVDTYMYVDWMEYQPLPQDSVITSTQSLQKPKIQRQDSGIQIQLSAGQTAQVTLTDLNGRTLTQRSIADNALLRWESRSPLLIRVEQGGQSHTELLAPVW
jgi:beta-glucanase (GH16 family)